MTHTKDSEATTMYDKTTSGTRPARSRPASAGLLCSISLALGAPGLAQAIDVSGTELLAAGLNNPSGIAFAANGGLYVTEVGNGGPANADHSNCTFSPPQPAVERCYGETGAVVHVLPDGGFERIATGLPSLGLPNGSGEGGPSDLSFHGTAAYVTIAWGGNPANRDGLGAKSHLFGNLIRVTQGGAVQQLADVAAHEARENPYGGAVDSNPNGVLALPARRIVADAGANALIEVGANGRTHTLAVLPAVPPVPNLGPREPVPTSVIEGPDGALYVGQLTGFPFFAGSSPVLRVEADGSSISAVAAGFTAVVDIAFDAGGALYVLEVARGQQVPFPPPPPNPGLGIGRLLRQCPGSPTPEVLVTGLSFARGVAIGPDGAAYFTNNGLSPTTGEVRRLAVAACP
jgi:hypothetical protein